MLKLTETQLTETELTALKTRLLEPGGYMRVAPLVATFAVTPDAKGAVVLLARLYQAAAAFDKLAETTPPTGDVPLYLHRYAVRHARRDVRAGAWKARRSPCKQGVGHIQEVVSQAGRLVLAVMDGAL